MIAEMSLVYLVCNITHGPTENIIVCKNKEDTIHWLVNEAKVSLEDIQKIGFLNALRSNNGSLYKVKILPLYEPINQCTCETPCCILQPGQKHIQIKI